MLTTCTCTKLNNFQSVIFQSCKFSYPARGGKWMQNHVKTHSITLRSPCHSHLRDNGRPPPHWSIVLSTRLSHGAREQPRRLLCIGSSDQLSSTADRQTAPMGSDRIGCSVIPETSDTNAIAIAIVISLRRWPARTGHSHSTDRTVAVSCPLNAINYW